MALIKNKQYCAPFIVKVPKCIRYFVLQTAEITQQVVITFTDGLERGYVYYANTDVNGFVTIDTETFPDGLFNPYAGIFQVTYRLASDTYAVQRNFQTIHGLFPQLNLSITDTYYTTTAIVPSSYLVDNRYFMCCCNKEFSCIPEGCCGSLGIDVVFDTRQITNLVGNIATILDTFKVTWLPCCPNDIVFTITAFIDGVYTEVGVSYLSSNTLEYTDALPPITFELEWEYDVSGFTTVIEFLDNVQTVLFTDTCGELTFSPTDSPNPS